MEKIVTIDKHGRLYLPEDVRRILKAKTLVLRLFGESLLIEPIDEDPIKALGKLGKEKLKDKSIKTLRREALEEIEKNVSKKIR